MYRGNALNIRPAASFSRHHVPPVALCASNVPSAVPLVPCCLQVWVKSSAEMSFLYGNHILKSGLAKITENTPNNAGVVVFSMSDIPLGFGVAAKSTAECRTADPGIIVTLHQGDIGEFLRSEEDL